jgi:O-antigen ligase
MLWNVLSISWALDETVAFAKLPTALSLFFLYLVAVSFRPSRREVHWVCAAMVLGGVLAAMLAYVFGLDQLASGGDARGRLVLGEMDSNPNTLGAVLLVPLGLTVAGAIASRGWLQRLVIIGCMAIISMGIFISMSRAALVAMIAMLAVFLYRLKARKQIVAAMVLLVGVSAAAPQQFYDRIEATVSGEDSTGAGRTEIWKTGIRAFSEVGLVGVGLNNFIEVYKQYASGGRGHGAHNVYLRTAVEVGIPGLVLLLVAVASGFLAMRRIARAGHRDILVVACEAVLVAMLTGILFGDRLWTKSFWLAWILLPWAVSSAPRSGEREESNVSQS